MARRLDSWLDEAPTLESDSALLDATYRRSLVDLAALRFSPLTMAGHSLPAAGLPWFMTMFGRDSILTSLQALPFAPELARTTLRALGERQGTRVDDFRDEDPADPARDALEMTAFENDRIRRTTAARARHRLRRAPRQRALVRYSRSVSNQPGLRSTGSTIRELKVPIRRTSAATKRPVSRTSAGRTRPISYRDGALPGFLRATCELQGYA
jgi:hypothetical protein